MSHLVNFDHPITYTKAMKKITLLLSIAFTIAVSKNGFAQNSTALNGKQYKIEMTKAGSSDAALVQTIIFKGGLLQTPGFSNLGFKEAVAYVKPTGDYFTWASTVNSTKEGAMGWQGNVKGEKIEGDCLWRKSGADPVQYHFTGTEIKTGSK